MDHFSIQKTRTLGSTYLDCFKWKVFVRITNFGSHAHLADLSTDQDLEQGRWYHVAATYDSNTAVSYTHLTLPTKLEV